MTKLEKKIILLLSNHPGREFYGQELVERLGCSKASASALLRSLADRKIIWQNVRGHMKFYQIDSDNVEVKKLKIAAAMDKLAPVVAKLRSKAGKIMLFGSASRGEQSAGSDIDLLVIGQDKEGVRELIRRLPAALKIQALTRTPSEWSEMEVKEPEFYREIKSGITLYEHVPRI